MTARRAATSPRHELLIPPVLRDLRSVASALITRDGTLRDANPGFMNLLPDEIPAASLFDVRYLFVQPRFDQFAAREGSAPDGMVYQGIINIGDADVEVRSVHGAIYAHFDNLLMIAEHDVVQLEANVRTLRMLNNALSESQRHVVRLNREVSRLQRVLERRESGMYGAVADREALLRVMSEEVQEPETSARPSKRDRKYVPTEMWKDVWSEWTAATSTGIRSIDSEHREMISLCRRAIRSFCADRDVIVFRSQLRAFREKAALHFGHEERVMKVMHSCFYSEHKAEHDELLKEVDHLLAMMDPAPSLEDGLDIASFIRNWLVRHGREQDNRIEGLFR